VLSKRYGRELMTCTDFSSLWPPLVVLRGTRVALRSFSKADLTPRYISWLNDPEIVRFSNQRFHHHDLSSCASYLATFEKSDNLFVAIDDLSDSLMVGTLTVYRNRYHGTADLGILVGDSRVRGRGYGFEAWVLITEWLIGECGMRKVTCGTLACNRAMRSVAERSGMRLEAVRASQEIVEGESQDVLYYARFRGDP
jgi:[ribosomal protein S5]-alanine N-acetyltransferase